MMQKRGAHGEVLTSRVRIPRWLAVVSGVAGSILGFATNLYSSEFRNAIASSGRVFNSTTVSIIIAAVGASTVTLFTYRWLLRRQQERTEIFPGEIVITPDVLNVVDDEQDSVVGRTLHFLEAKRNSPELVIFLHGLGLDASDFWPYMAESRFHCIALTLYGFNVEDATDDHYRPISFQTHVQILAYALAALMHSHPRKRVTVVGFSLGADAVLLLPQFAAQALRGLELNRAILLDPNLSSSTTTLSARIAAVDPARPLAELIKILENADDIGEFRILCEYLHKITAKDFGQVQRHAREVIAMWDSPSYERFLDRLGQLAAAVGGVDVVLSFDYERHFNGIARGAAARGLGTGNLESSKLGHFDLISPRSLRERLGGIL